MSTRAWTGIVGVAVLAAGVVAGSTPPTPATAAATDQAQPTATATVATWSAALDGRAPCPEGSTRSATLQTTGFGDIPNSRYNNGWSVVDHGVGGGDAARSTVSSSDTTDYFFLRWSTAPVGARTMFAFASRGTVGASAYSRVDVNSVSNQVAASSTEWSGKVYDITAATDDEGGRLGPWFEHRSYGGRTSWWEVDNAQVYTCRSAPVARLGGSDRYATSARIAAEFGAGRSVVYLASGETYPDSLTGSALAGSKTQPVLLTRHGEIPSSVAAQLDRLNPGRIVVLGGTGSVSNSVVTQAQQYTSGTVTRIAGDDRYGTAAAVSEQFPVGGPVAYVVSGQGYADALGGGALAGYRDAPLLLTAKGSLPPATRTALDRLQPGRIVVLGGTSSVSTAVLQELRDYTDGTVSRIAGSNRYSTAAAISEEFPVGVRRVYVTTGANFPDALSGSALAAKVGGPVLLSTQTDLTDPTRAALDRLDADAGRVFGSSSSVQPIVMDQLGARVG